MLIPTWLWSSRSLPARAARLALLPPSLLYRLGMAVRTRAYALRLLHRSEAPVPVVAIGNLTVGGSGKTPVASWVAGHYAAMGLQPAIVLRGYGGDEATIHRQQVETAIVVEDPDRVRGARTAAANGADVIVLDDAFQRLDLARDLNIALVSTESSRAARWTLPAGPWREGLGALRRADVIVVTRKRADVASAERVIRRIERRARGKPIALARLGITGFRGLLTGEWVPPAGISGARILAAAGIADPRSFAAQCREFGAEVRLLPFEDHRTFTDDDVQEILHLGRRVDYVVITQKDAVKLKGMWPEDRAEPLVAALDVTWEQGKPELETALDAVVSKIEDLIR
jgi:tetraacyldisaccharide 4'-kinase